MWNHVATLSAFILAATHVPSHAAFSSTNPNLHPKTNTLRSPFEFTLSMSDSSDNDSNVNVDSKSNDSAFFRFLGRGENAIVRPGVVLVAPLHEYNHYLRRAAIFVHAMGLNEYDEYVIRGVIIDNPTPFTMSEMSQIGGDLGENLMFRGGDSGSESAMMLHRAKDIHADNNVQESSMIGTSGIYEGGLEAAVDACRAGTALPEQFKFFFNYCQFTENELEQILREADTDTGDAWASVEISPDFVLDPDFDRGDAWSNLRRRIAPL